MAKWRNIAWLRLLVLSVALGPLLSGCLLISGRIDETAVSPLAREGGSQRTTFYSSDTSGAPVIQYIDVGSGRTLLDVTLTGQLKSGEMQIEILTGDENLVALTLNARTDRADTMSGNVITNVAGQIRYRLKTTNARNGEYTIAWKPPPPPTPTPTATPRPTATATPSPTATPTATPTLEPTATLTPTLDLTPTP